MHDFEKPPFEKLNRVLDQNDFKFAVFLTLIGLVQLIFFDYLVLKPDWLLFYSSTTLIVLIGYLILLFHTVFRILIGHRRVKLQDVLFFVLSYFVFIIEFALAYNCVNRFLEPSSGPVFSTSAHELHILDFLYYSGVVMTTLGFGDIIPVHILAKLLSIFQAAIGQILLVLSIGSVISRMQNK